ncbi:uncharacterized protein LOC126380970 [Pectinophora gossypiella]|uniref:uncharacterized protein LOC126380970 n=1 Tax=Pectinophora gossypiella TaxID=13191 RepID=UPI00214E9B37|nr:uncharacterized protein LOC126380970 [Pectinophora gossypiella]
MVNTRSTTRKNLERKLEDDEQLKNTQVENREKEEPIAASSKTEKTITLDVGSAIKPEHRQNMSTSHRSRKSSAASSLAAKRKRLELEAAEAKARLQMNIIDKRLEADLADLQEEYSPPSESSILSTKRHDVEKWMDRSQADLKAQLTPENNNGLLHPPVEEFAGTSGSVQQLTAALKDLTTSFITTRQNPNLLSRISWSVHGRVRAPHGTSARHASLLLTAAPRPLHPRRSQHDHARRILQEMQDELRLSYNIDSLGVAGKPRENAEDVRAVALLERTATFVNGKWEVGLPWKDEHCKMPESYPNALTRLKGVEKKMAANPAYAQRENRVAVAGDIKDMFLRVKIRSEDQNALRFLWREDPTQPVKTYAMTSLIFGANCSPFIAQFVKNLNAKRFTSTMPSAVAAVCDQHFMDDYLGSLPDEDTAIQMACVSASEKAAGGGACAQHVRPTPAVSPSPPAAAATVAAAAPSTSSVANDALRKCYESPTPTICATNITVNSIPSEGGYKNLQMHIFSDASTKAMCAVAYWRWNDNGKIYTSFIASKCRVAPVKPITVPRLELQAALLAARLADVIQKEHKMTTSQRYFWCDSTTVLHWIGNSLRRYSTFVANRLGEIDELTRADEWRYVPTKLNVADTATREAYDPAIFEHEWFMGPSFLQDDESSWPRDCTKPEVRDENLECVNIITHLSDTCHLPVPDPERFSSWLRLQRSTAAVMKFIGKCRKQTDGDWRYMEDAERLLLKYAQAASFNREIIAIQKGKPLDRSSKLLTLSPVMDEHGLLRVGGRIDAAADVKPETKHPLILDGRHHVTRLLVRRHHVDAAHGNQETVVNNLKQKYYIIRLRPTVKYVTSKCMLCRIKRAKPEIPRMGNLPAGRMAHHQRPFTHCGLDLFGPMEVTVGRRREKRYGVIFTCLTVRAIHLEIVHSLTTDSLLMALRRMAARRGWPLCLYSDNGTNLRGADNELKRSTLELDNETLERAASNKGTQWKFIPPVSPHWGGAWERLIRSVKISLKTILSERAPKDEVLLTLMTEVENMVNSRPLTHVSVEAASEESLTPNHLLLGSSSNLPVHGAFDDSDLYLRKQWRKGQRLADMFWQRWVREVLPDMLPRKKWNQEQSSLQVGDLVFIADSDAPRNVWPRGVIEKVFPGRDGRVRLVAVRTRSGLLKRSAARVARIPLSNECCASTGVGRVSDELTK